MPTVSLASLSQVSIPKCPPYMLTPARYGALSPYERILTKVMSVSRLPWYAWHALPRCLVCPRTAETERDQTVKKPSRCVFTAGHSLSRMLYMTESRM